MIVNVGDARSDADRPHGGTAAHRAYAHVKERLLDGRFAGGMLLSENELAHRLGLSRTPVRQAFVQLEVEGLVALYPKRGALVVPISASEADDVLEARLLLERHCTRKAARTGGAALAQALREAIAEQELFAVAERSGGDAAGRERGVGFAQSDRRFHRAIVAAAGNVLLLRQYDALRDRQQRIAAATVAREPVRVQRFVAEHRAIAEALERGDGDAAADLMAEHLHGAHELARR